MFVRLPITYYIIFPFLVTCTYYHSYRCNLCQSIPFPFPSKVMEIHILSYDCTVSHLKKNKIKSLLLFYFNILLFLFLKDILDYRLFVQPISSFTFSLSLSLPLSSSFLHYNVHSFIIIIVIVILL